MYIIYSSGTIKIEMRAQQQQHQQQRQQRWQQHPPDTVASLWANKRTNGRTINITIVMFNTISIHIKIRRKRTQIRTRAHKNTHTPTKWQHEKIVWRLRELRDRTECMSFQYLFSGLWRVVHVDFSLYLLLLLAQPRTGYQIHSMPTFQHLNESDW